MHKFEYHAPGSLAEVFDLLQAYGDDAKLIAGGTALVIMMRQGLVRPGHLVSLSGLRDLSGIRADNGSLRIGGLTTHREVEISPLVEQRFPVLTETMHKVATMRIRNMGTIGGNLAHSDPALDPPVTLTALGASVRIVGKDGERVVPIDEFFVDYYETVLQPGEIVAEVLVPALPARSSATFIKFLPRTADDYATVAVAARLTLDDSGQNVQDVRIALGAAGSTTIRARATEDALRGQPATDDSFREAAKIVKSEVDPVSDIRGSSKYKTDMAEVFVRRALVQARAAPTTSSSGSRRTSPGGGRRST